jgi:hypothetical protein
MARFVNSALAAAVVAVVTLAAIGGTSAAAVQPFTEPKADGAAFFDSFSSGLGRWIPASDEKYNGA